LNGVGRVVHELLTQIVAVAGRTME
jgi:hypothetical protein